MQSARVDEAYGQATSRWPGVAFGRPEYAAHVGDPPPPYAVDMYLAGAAGYRVDEAWRVIERELGPSTRGILRRQPTADLSVEELWNETLVRLMDEDAQRPPLPAGGRRPAKIVRYRGLVALLNYLTVVARRTAISRKRGMREVSGSAPGDSDDPGTAAPAEPAGATPTP